MNICLDYRRISSKPSLLVFMHIFRSVYVYVWDKKSLVECKVHNNKNYNTNMCIHMCLHAQQLIEVWNIVCVFFVLYVCFSCFFYFKNSLISLKNNLKIFYSHSSLEFKPFLQHTYIWVEYVHMWGICSYYLCTLCVYVWESPSFFPFFVSF